MNLCVMSRNESADSTAIAAKTFGLREATFHAPNPPDEKPNTPRLRASGIVRWFASTKATTSFTRYCSKLPVTGESTHWPQPQRDLVALVLSAAVVAGVLSVFVRDARFVQVVAE